MVKHGIQEVLDAIREAEEVFANLRVTLEKDNQTLSKYMWKKQLKLIEWGWFLAGQTKNAVRHPGAKAYKGKNVLWCIIRAGVYVRKVIHVISNSEVECEADKIGLEVYMNSLQSWLGEIQEMQKEQAVA